MIAGMTQAMIRLVNVADGRELGCDILRIIGRPVVDQDDFVIGIIEFT